MQRFDQGREILKWIAIVSMTIDHLGYTLYPKLIVLRIIGRISFPLFSYLLVLGVENTRSLRNYFSRLFLFALLSQVPYYLALGYAPFEQLNIFFTLSFAVITICYPLLLLPISIASLFINFDYGVYGFILISSMRILRENVKYGIFSLLILGGLSFMMSEIQIFFLLALPLILLHKTGSLDIQRGANRNDFYPLWRKYFFYIYYPLHLTAIYLLSPYLRM